MMEINVGTPADRLRCAGLNIPALHQPQLFIGVAESSQRYTAGVITEIISHDRDMIFRCRRCGRKNSGKQHRRKVQHTDGFIRGMRRFPVHDMELRHADGDRGKLPSSNSSAVRANRCWRRFPQQRAFLALPVSRINGADIVRGTDSRRGVRFRFAALVFRRRRRGDASGAYRE